MKLLSRFTSLKLFDLRQLLRFSNDERTKFLKGKGWHEQFSVNDVYHFDDIQYRAAENKFNRNHFNEETDRMIQYPFDSKQRLIITQQLLESLSRFELAGTVSPDGFERQYGVSESKQTELFSAIRKNIDSYIYRINKTDFIRYFGIPVSFGSNLIKELEENNFLIVESPDVSVEPLLAYTVEKNKTLGWHLINAPYGYGEIAVFVNGDEVVSIFKYKDSSIDFKLFKTTK